MNIMILATTKILVYTTNFVFVVNSLSHIAKLLKNISLKGVATIFSNPPSLAISKSTHSPENKNMVVFVFVEYVCALRSYHLHMEQ